MCGIAGIAGRPDPEALERMLRATRHRGPDDQGTYDDEVVSLGMNRLSILDLSPAGHQPMRSPDGQLVLVYNGEMYNFREERRHLESLGHTFRSQTDSEVVLALYRQYGPRCLDRMRGMFAFALWDRDRHELFAARDHLGVKPFLYAELPGQVVFCSELKGLMAHGTIPRSLDQLSLVEYLIYGHVNQPRTIFSRVRALLPGHYLVWREGSPPAVTCYWSIAACGEANGSPRSYADVLATTRDLVLRSVSEELVSDVPLGVFLSGGIDSAVVVAAMRAGGASAIQTYSIGFGGEGGGSDESSAARESAAFFGTDHYAVDIAGRDVEAEFETMVRGFDQPVAMDGYNSYLVSKHARRGVTVALSGLGADELFGGYRLHRDLLRSQLSPRIAERLLQTTQPLWEHLPLSEGRMVEFQEAAAAATIPGHYSLTQRFFKPVHVGELLKLGTPAPSLRAVYRDLIRANAELDDPSLADPFQRISLISMRSFMTHRLLRDADAVSMIHSLEIRVPLIDRRIVEYVFPLPWTMKFDAGSIRNRGVQSRVYREVGLKRILVDAFADLLPPGILDRPKRGFTMPIKTWLETAFQDRIAATFEDAGPGFFPREALAQIHARWRTDGGNAPRVWSLLVLTEWLRQMDITSLDDTEPTSWPSYARDSVRA